MRFIVLAIWAVVDYVARPLTRQFWRDVVRHYRSERYRTFLWSMCEPVNAKAWHMGPDTFALLVCAPFRGLHVYPGRVDCLRCDPVAKLWDVSVFVADGWAYGDVGLETAVRGSGQVCRLPWLLR